MLRVKSSALKTNKRKNILNLISGFRNSNLFKQGQSKYKKAFVYKYISRRIKKRFFRSFWIKKINSILKLWKLTYSNFIMSLKKQNILINRQMLYLLLFLFCLQSSIARSSCFVSSRYELKSHCGLKYF